MLPVVELKGESGDYQGHQYHERKIWKNDFMMPTHDFKEVTCSNEAMLKFLSGKNTVDAEQKCLDNNSIKLQQSRGLRTIISNITLS